MNIQPKPARPASRARPGRKPTNLPLLIAVVGGVFTLMAAVIAGIFAIVSSLIESPNTLAVIDRLLQRTPAAITATAVSTIAASTPAASTLAASIPAASTSLPVTLPEATGTAISPALVPISTPWPLSKAISDTDNGPICTLRTALAPAGEGRPGAVEISYVIPAAGGYCTWIIPLNDYNASAHNALTFWVKGRQGGEVFEVGITHTGTYHGQEPKIQQTASAVWQQHVILLSDFPGLELDALENMSLGFTYELGSGTISVADFVFTP